MRRGYPVLRTVDQWISGSVERLNSGSGDQSNVEQWISDSVKQLNSQRVGRSRRCEHTQGCATTRTNNQLGAG
eukprot:942764-Prorocentrum_minimum.AAC.1